MKIVSKSILLFMVSFNSWAFIGIGTDTAMLINLVTTTASQLNELEKLVSNSERFTQRMQEYNLLMQDEYFRAQRVLYVAESVAAKKSIQDLGTLNWAIRNLRYNMDELNRLMAEYAKIKGEEKEIQKKVEIQRNLNQKKSDLASSQIEKSTHAPTQARANQLTAQNTALLLEAQIDSHNTQLEILERVSTTNRLLAEQLEEKRIEQIQKEKAFGVQKDTP